MQKKGITYLLASVLILALFFQFIRFDTIIKLSKNINDKGRVEKLVSSQVPDIPRETFLVIYDEEEANSVFIKEQVLSVLNYMKKNSSIVDVKALNFDGNYDCIIITLESLNKIKDITYLLNYVDQGGSLIFMERLLKVKNLSYTDLIFGIESNNDLITARGIKVHKPVLIGTKGFETDTYSIENSSLDIKLIEDTELYLTSYDDIPLLWEAKYGEGEIIYFNGTMTNEKNNTGLIAGIISLTKDNFIYPIINSKMVHIDDFPAPIPQGTDEKIAKEFQRTIPKFYKEVWWSDMLKASKRYNVKYTGYIIESYNKNVKQPFIEDNLTARNDLLIYGRELLKSGGELGIHGYNHQSFAFDGFIKQDLGYNSWHSKEDMIKSLEEVSRYAHSVFPQYKFKAYVPPSNILSPEGRDALVKGLKDLKIISSLYINNSLGDNYEQEFQVSDDGIIEFPRISSGYNKTDEEMWSIYNGINLFGVFSHFVHPDDVLDYKRNNGESWTSLYKDFSSILSEINKKYWWLTPQTTSEAGASLVTYVDSIPYISYNNNKIMIYCENFRTDSYFIYRTNENIKSFKNCEVLNIDENIYLIRMKENGAEIIISNEG